MNIYSIEQMERLRERRIRERVGRRREGLNDNEQINNDKRKKEINNIEPSLEDLLSTPIIKNVNKKKYEEKENEKKETLFEFKMKNIYELYVDMLYYFSSPEILKNRKITHRTKYDLYKDLDSENFIKEQKRRIKTILNLPGIGPDLVIKSRKLLNYRKIFSAELDGFNKDKDNEAKFDNINILRTKMEKYSFLCLSENNETKILDYLNELKEEFKKVTIDIKILGLVHFNFIENNLVLLLTIIMNKLEKNKNKKNINDFISVCTNILNYFKSSKLFFS